jgi:NAD+ diphosphatase
VYDIHLFCIGESVEHSVEREVAEEVGLEVSSVKYLCSQHWPHPAPRLMLGCIATAKSGVVRTFAHFCST